MCQMFAGQNPATYEYATRSLRLNGQSTSIRLARAFRKLLTYIAEAEELSTPPFLSRLHSAVLDLPAEAPTFTSLLRAACLVPLRRLAHPAPAPALSGASRPPGPRPPGALPPRCDPNSSPKISSARSSLNGVRSRLRKRAGAARRRFS